MTGPLNYDGFMKDLGEVDDLIKIVPFVDQRALLPKLDLIVCRSGASTIAEIQSFGLASILIPSPHVANNHQYYNAKSLADRDATVLIEEKFLDEIELHNAVEDLMSDLLQRQSLSEHVKAMAKPNALSDMVNLIEGIVNE